MSFAPEPYPGPPGCECDLSLPLRERCNKSGWIRCQGALAAQLAQYDKRRAEREAAESSPPVTP